VTQPAALTQLFVGLVLLGVARWGGPVFRLISEAHDDGTSYGRTLLPGGRTIEDKEFNNAIANLFRFVAGLIGLVLLGAGAVRLLT